MKPTHLSVTDLSDILSTSRRVIESRIAKGLLPPLVDVNGEKLFDVTSLEEVSGLEHIFSNDWEPELTPNAGNNYKIVELFAGAGGMSLGFEKAGFEPLLLNEIDKHAANTLILNRPKWNVVNKDIKDVDFRSYNGKVDVVTGGFPCQAFSYAGKSMGFNDTRGTLFFEYARAVKEIQPKIMLAENVRALFSHDNGKTLETIKKVIDEIGYQLIEPEFLKAIFYKVPQKRERLFLVAIRKDLFKEGVFKYPSRNGNIYSVKDALKKGELYDTDCPVSPGTKYPERKKEIMDMVPEGGYWRDLPIKTQKEYMKASFHLGGGKTGMARRLSWTSPSLTLTCSPAQKQTERCHPEETRPLQVREYARIQTFPDSWEFTGPITAQYKQIGNAVPVNLASAIARSVLRALTKI
jgi:DNA (cytosine-5)-methyltransferase 1